ncbi:hypothetical protein NDU88_001177 [Pleurodeles waltl]|uniref:Uncharacterized protein n=1 Tax=Pleurodeles waltl TaxID=8319 RepID=A0AAV7VYN4_PLEWA|nr:hypothetical protein NDU88_001177 [Pleurodeles waltl]
MPHAATRQHPSASSTRQPSIEARTSSYCGAAGVTSPVRHPSSRVQCGAAANQMASPPTLAPAGSLLSDPPMGCRSRWSRRTRTRARRNP